MLAEIVHPLPHGAVANSKLLGDFFLGAAVDKNGTQRLEATLIRMGGLAKKVVATAVIHDPNSLEMLLLMRDKPRKMVGSNWAAVDENHSQTLKKAAPPSLTPKKRPTPSQPPNQQND
jgi:hypothetical protein